MSRKSDRLPRDNHSSVCEHHTSLRWVSIVDILILFTRIYFQVNRIVLAVAMNLRCATMISVRRTMVAVAIYAIHRLSVFCAFANQAFTYATRPITKNVKVGISMVLRTEERQCSLIRHRRMRRRSEYLPSALLEYQWQLHMRLRRWLCPTIGWPKL